MIILAGVFFALSVLTFIGAVWLTIVGPDEGEDNYDI